QSSALFLPVGSGRTFSGVVEVSTGNVLIFSRSMQGGAQRASMRTVALDKLRDEPGANADAVNKVIEDIALVREAGTPFDRERFLKGELTPVFFGSALTNFGVEPFFDRFVELAPAPSNVKVLLPGGGDR